MWPEEILYGAASTLWLILTALYVFRGLRQKGAFRADLRHELAGPFASFIPLVGILLSAHYSQYLPPWGAWLCMAFIAALAIVAAQLLAHWVTDGVSMQSIHPGYLLPVVPGFFVASIGFSSIHAHDAALAAYGVGAFFWLVMGTVVTVRLMTGGEVPPAAKTGLSAYLAAPATANIAWMVAHPGPVGAVQLGLTGVLVIMALMQVMLLAEYRKLPFTQMFWVFTFPVGATANYSIRWLATTDLPAVKFTPGRFSASRQPLLWPLQSAPRRHEVPAEAAAQAADETIAGTFTQSSAPATAARPRTSPRSAPASPVRSGPSSPG